MHTRRSFIGALMALPFVSTIAKAAWSSRIVYQPPRIVGVPGKTYIRAGEPEAHRLFPPNRLYLNGKDVTDFCFEFDSAAGWIGGYEHHYEGGKVVLHDPPEPNWAQYERDPLTKVMRRVVYRTGDGLPRYWQFGKVEVR